MFCIVYNKCKNQMESKYKNKILKEDNHPYSSCIKEKHGCEPIVDKLGILLQQE